MEHFVLIKKYGFSEVFLSQILQENHLEPARVLSQEKGFYRINCTHTNEPGCAIQKALEMGELDMDRWQSYRKLKAENDYREDKESYMIAKGRREKEISKLIKKMPIRV